MPGSLPRRVIGGGDPWEGRGDGSAVISWAPASCSEDWPGLELPFRTEGPSRAQRRAAPSGGRPEELPPTQLWAASVHGRCQAQPWAQGVRGAVSTCGRTPMISPPKLFPAVRVLALCEASVPWCLGRKETQEVLSCPGPVSPLAVRPPASSAPRPGTAGPLGSCSRPGVQHGAASQCQAPGPTDPALARTRPGSLHTVTSWICSSRRRSTAGWAKGTAAVPLLGEGLGPLQFTRRSRLRQQFPGPTTAWGCLRWGTLDADPAPRTPVSGRRQGPGPREQLDHSGRTDGAHGTAGRGPWAPCAAPAPGWEPAPDPRTASPQGARGAVAGTGTAGAA